MARWLAGLGMCCGLAVMGGGFYAHAQRPSTVADSTSSIETKSLVTKPASEARPGADDRQASPPDTRDRSRDERSRDDRAHDDRAHDDQRRGEGHRSPPHAGGWAGFAWRRVPEAVRRDGGSLELLPLLRMPQALAELGVKEGVKEREFKAELDAYFADMQKRIDEDAKLAQAGRGVDWGKLLTDRIEKENAQFQEFFNHLSPEQQDRLIGLFVQARGYRAISNQIVSSKMGLKADEAADLRKMVETIREEVIRESQDRFRRAFDRGDDFKEFEKLIRENQKKMDARIEKKLTSEQREKLAALRGKEVPEPRDWLLRGVEMPRPPAPPRPNSRPGPKPPSKSDSCSD